MTPPQIPGRSAPLSDNPAGSGPTIESRSGRTAIVRHRNELPVPTVVHLHGGRTPPESDGYATDLVLPAGGAYPGTEAAHSHGGHDPAAVISHGEREYV